MLGRFAQHGFCKRSLGKWVSIDEQQVDRTLKTRCCGVGGEMSDHSGLSLARRGGGRVLGYSTPRLQKRWLCDIWGGGGKGLMVIRRLRMIKNHLMRLQSLRF